MEGSPYLLVLRMLKMVLYGCSQESISREKDDFWGELGAIRGLWDDPWCVKGDFNFVRFPGERRNDFIFTKNIRRFSDVIEELRLKDLSFSRGQFTWCSGLNSQATSSWTTS